TYQVAVQTPQYKIDSMQALANTPVTGSIADSTPQILGNLVNMTSAMRPAVVSHYNIQPLINVYASVDGRDLGAVSDELTACDHVHGCGDGQQHPGGLLCPRTDERGQECPGRSAGSWFHPHSPGNYDGAGDDHWHGPIGYRAWRGR